MTPNSSTSGAGFYLDAREYYVPPEQAESYPVRHGDVFRAELEEIADWHACQLAHPTCELGKSSVKQVQVIRVEPLSRFTHDKDRAKVTAGVSEVDGQLKPEHAHTFFLAPYSETSGPMYSDFREVKTVASDFFIPAHRLAALSHDCRVTLIRREIYFRYRIMLSFDDVRALEATRISSDAKFSGPRPSWAPAVTQ